MTFSSLSFIFIFFPLTFILYALCRGDKSRNIVLAAASIIFYAFGEPAAVLILLFSVICNYLFGFMVAGKDEKQNRLYFTAAVVINIGLLLCYRYAGALVSLVQGQDAETPAIRIPLGMAFFTLQGISYVTDVYRRKCRVQKKLMNVLLYISLFPHVIAGPLMRFGDMEEQLHVRSFSADRVSRGLRRFIFGLGKKVLVAGQLGIVADRVFSCDTDTLGTFTAWAGALCFTLQIFFDFSGYSDMAIGLGCIFGFDYGENFDYPYASSSVKDFWRRWHISLSSWFKEYVYIPLGGNRKGALRTDLNILVVFLLAGMWYGAGVTFIVWALINGILLILENRRIIPVKQKWFRSFGHIYVPLVAVISFVFFRSASVEQALGVLGHMITISSGDSIVSSETGALITPLHNIVLWIAVILSTPVCRTVEKRCIQRGHENICTASGYIFSAVVYILSILVIISGSFSTSVYFRF